jgi:hypothetical protein
MDALTGTGRPGGIDNATDGTSDDEAGDDQDDDGNSEVPTATAQAVAYWLRREPNIEPERLAEKIGKSLRSVYRYLPPDYPRLPGIARERTRRRPGPARPNSRASDVNRHHDDRPDKREKDRSSYSRPPGGLSLRPLSPPVPAAICLSTLREKGDADQLDQ